MPHVIRAPPPAIAPPAGALIARSQSRWTTDMVVVVAAFNEYDPLDLPRWMRHDKHVTFYVYQRHNASLPHYSPNLGWEGGVYIQFVLEHYEDLPKQIAFVQAHPEEHNPDWRKWLGCVRPDAAWATLNPLYIVRPWTYFARRHGDVVPLVEQCWRNTLAAFGLRELLASRARPDVAFFCCAQLVVSREQLRSRGRAAFLAAHQHFAGAGAHGTCHQGPLRWHELSTPLLCTEKMLACAKRGDKDACACGGCRHANRSGEPWCSVCKSWKTACNPQLASSADVSTKHTMASAFEHLHHVFLGGQPFVMPPPTPEMWCRMFLPDAECIGSPCRLEAANDGALPRVVAGISLAP